MAGTILASAIVAQATTILQDAGAVRWTAAELLDWLNAGVREIATITDAAVIVGNLTLVAGTKQTLPAGGLFLREIYRNMGAGGATPGEAVRPTSRKQLDSYNPSWHSATATLVVKNYVYEAAVPRTFYVYPPMSGATTVEAAYAALPAAVTSGQAIPLEDRYASPLLDYTLYRAFAKDAELEGMLARAAAHYAAMQQSLGNTAQAASAAEAP
jgi:hypothetical protein